MPDGMSQDTAGWSDNDVTKSPLRLRPLKCAGDDTCEMRGMQRVSCTEQVFRERQATRKGETRRRSSRWNRCGVDILSMPV